MSVPTDVMATRSLASSLGASAPRDDARERAAMTSVGTDTSGPQFKAPQCVVGEVFIVVWPVANLPFDQKLVVSRGRSI